MTVRKWCIVLVSIIPGIFRPYFIAVDFTECSNESISQHRYSHVLMFMVETFIFNNGWGWRTFGAFGKPDATIEEIPNMYNVEWFQMVFAGNVLPLDLMQVVLCMCLCVCVFMLTPSIRYSNHCHSITFVDWSCKLHWPLKLCGLVLNVFFFRGNKLHTHYLPFWLCWVISCNVICL